MLITGGAGFIGAHLVTRLLGLGATVAVLDNLSTVSHANLAACHEAGLLWRNVFIHDIRDQGTANLVSRWSPDIIIHLAAQARVTRSVANIIEDASRNILGTLNVLNAAGKPVPSGSSWPTSGGTIYGEMPDDQSAFTESSARQPVSPYGVPVKSQVCGRRLPSDQRRGIKLRREWYRIEDARHREPLPAQPHLNPGTGFR